MRTTPSAALNLDVPQCICPPNGRCSRWLARIALWAGALALTGCQFDSSGSGFADAPGLAAPNAHGCACACGAAQEVPAGIAAGADDAAEASDGSVALSNAAVVLAQSADEPTLVGLRFDDVEIGPGSTIETAYVQFTAGPGNSPPGVAVAVPVPSGNDDASELPNTTVVLDNAALTLQSGDLVGLRFLNVPIPSNAIVISAHVQFEAGASTTGVTMLTIRGERSPDAAPFAAGLGNLSTRSRTFTSTWAAGMGAQRRGTAQRAIDVSGDQEITEQPG